MMKKLKRLKVKNTFSRPFETGEFVVQRVSEHSATISSGQGCFYHCLAYIGSKYGMSYNANMLSDDYIYGGLSEDDNWDGTHNKGDLNGPSTFLPNPDKEDSTNPLIFNPSIMQYIHTKFNTNGSGLWSRGSEMQSYFDADGTRNSSGYLMAIIHPGSTSVTHAVILDSYENGAYSYYDPTFDCNSTVSQNRIIVGVEITGRKK